MSYRILFDEATAGLLARYGFDEAVFARLRARVQMGADLFSENIARGSITAPLPGELASMPSAPSPVLNEFARLGTKAIAAGEVGVVILAGGMATRFGGAVKAAAEALPGRSFLDLKLRDVGRAAQLAQGRVPVYLLVSFATDAIVRGLAQTANTDAVPIEVVPQSVSVRLTPTGEIFLDPTGTPSLYAPGHGDFTFAARATGALGRFRATGGRYLFMSNVDNLAATLDPAIIGAHIAHGHGVTAEVVNKEPGDRGGVPARVDGKLQIVEAFRFPADFPQQSLRVFNTNTFVFDAGAIDRDFDLDWFCVKKNLHGADVLQFERLAGQITAFVPSAYLVVSRTGVASRFEPMKDSGELDSRREKVRALLAARGVI